MKKSIIFFFFAAIFIFSFKCNIAITANLNNTRNSQLTISGSVDGLSPGDTVVLQNNGKDNLTITNSSGASSISFMFNTPINSSGSYYVTVLNQPITQTCTVGSGIGVAITDVVDVRVTCGNSTSYLVGGSVSGLAGSGLVLSNNGTDFKTISANGIFSFGNVLNDTDPYNVIVSTQPVSPNQVCTVTNGSGTIAGVSVNNIYVTCNTSSYSVSGNVTGLETGDQIFLKNNGGDLTNITGTGSGTDAFVFPTQVSDGAAYNVTISSLVIFSGNSQKTCSITNGSGTIAGAAVSSVSISCIPNSMFSLGGTLTGLGTGASLAIKQSTGTVESLVLTANGSFTFSTPFINGAGYLVSVQQNPTFPSQVCSITGGSGTFTGANITGISISCATNTFTPSVNIIGLTALGGTITIKNNNAQAAVISADGVHNFAVQNDATSYYMTISAQSPNINCNITGGSGVISGANVLATITCNPVSTYVVNVLVAGASISGGSGLLVQLNGTETSTSILSNTTYTFATQLHSGDTYAVTVTQNPNRANGNNKDQTCMATNASGTIGTANVTVNVNCSTVTYTVGGTISGLGASSILLVNNGLQGITASGASFTFPAQADATGYSISIPYQPTGLTCVAGGNSGTVTGANISSVTITCSATALYSVGGSVTGLLGSNLTLQNNGGDNLVISANGAFTFPTAVFSGTGYNVSILSQPTGPIQTCSVSNASGTVSANVTNISINCVITTYSISGTVTGLSPGDQLDLTNNWNDYTSIISSGGTDSFYFPKPMVNGDSYSVFTNFVIPSNRSCSTSSGIVSGADVVVSITCVPTYYVSGTVTGLATGKNVTLINNLSNYSYIYGNGSPIAYQFSIALPDTASYSVTISAAPADYICSFTTSATGAISGANATVNLNCIPKCGNGVIDIGETCDDSNTLSGDGCSNTCQTEGSFSPVIASDFDTPALDGWTATGLWHLSNVRSWTPSYSMRFANPSTNNFSTGSTVVGDLTSPPLTLPGTRQMSFYYFHNGECLAGTTCTYDKLSVEVSTDLGITWIPLEFLVDAETGLIYHNTNLAAYTGTVQVRFHFNSVDSAANTYEGSYIDNVTFY